MYRVISLNFIIDRTLKSYLTILLIVILAAVSTAQDRTAEEQLERAQELVKYGVLMEAVAEYQSYLQRVPGDTEARIALVDLLLRLNRGSQAIPHIERLRRDKPNHPKVKSFSTLYHQYGRRRYQQRVREFETRLKSTGNGLQVMLEYARFLMNNRVVDRSLEMYNKYLTRKPNDDTVRLELARQYAWNKRFTAAHRELDIILSVDPRNISAQLLSGDLYYWEGNEDEALTAYRKALATDPKNRDAKKKIDNITTTPGYREKLIFDALAKDPRGQTLNSLARHYLSVDRIFEADSLVQLRLSAAPYDEVALDLASEIEHHKLIRFNTMIKVYEERLKDAPYDTTAILFLARYYSSLPVFETALIHYDNYLELYPTDYQVRLERARILAWSGRSKEAGEEFKVISITLPDNREANLGLAEAILASDISLDEAEEIFRKDLEKYPDDKRSKIGYAETLRRQGRYDEARQLYLELLAEDSDDLQASQGLNWLDQDTSPLVRRLEKLIKIDPSDVAIRRQLAGFYYDQKRYWEAEDQVEILLAENPEDAQLRIFLEEIRARKNMEMADDLRRSRFYVAEHPDDLGARIKYADLLIINGEAETAIELYRTVLTQRPDDPEVSVKLAELLISQEDFEGGVNIYQRLADRNPRSFEYRYRLALALSWSGEYDRALFEFNRALDLDPNSMECRAAKADIYRWRGIPYAAYDEYKRILALDPTNKKAKKGLKELEEPFFRGVKYVFSQGWDNEDFLFREMYVGLIINVSLRMQAEGGWGRIYFEQSEITRQIDFTELGWFIYGNVIYRFDPLTRATAEGRFYTFDDYETNKLHLELAHDFKDIKELRGLTGRIYYTTRDAIFDVASIHSLKTFHDRLKSDKIGIIVGYHSARRLIFRSELSYMELSDGNSRTDLGAEIRYILHKNIQAGLLYDRVDAEMEKPEYWTPDAYSTLSAVIQLENTSTQWYYKIRGTVGRVLPSYDATRTINASFQYKATRAIYLGLALTDLLTTRIDGRYKYTGITGSVTWNW